MVRQVLGFVNAKDQRNVNYTVKGKLEGGVFGTRRFTDEGTFELPPSARRTLCRPQIAPLHLRHSRHPWRSRRRLALRSSRAACRSSAAETSDPITSRSSAELEL